MAERRPLTAGLSVVPPGADPEEVKAFITQDKTKKPEPPAAEEAAESAPAAQPEAPAAAPKRRRGKKSPLPVGLIPVTVRLRPEIAQALKRASLERQLTGEEVFTQQDLVELALEPWLRENGFLS